MNPKTNENLNPCSRNTNFRFGILDGKTFGPRTSQRHHLDHDQEESVSSSLAHINKV